MAPPMIWPGGIFNPVCASLLNMISWIEPSSVTTQLKPWPAQAFGEGVAAPAAGALDSSRSEEHTSELQSRLHLVCRLLLEKKNKLSGHAACHSSHRSSSYPAD